MAHPRKQRDRRGVTKPPHPKKKGKGSYKPRAEREKRKQGRPNRKTRLDLEGAVREAMRDQGGRR